METAALIGAFLSGIGAVLSSMFALRRARKRAEEECLKRIEEAKAAFREGVTFRDERR